MQCLVKFWRQKSIKIQVFIDDRLGTAPIFETSKAEANTVRISLVKCGFVINEEKFLWHLQKELIWLGLKIDLTKGLFTISENITTSILTAIKNIVKELTYSTARKLSRKI